MIPVVRRIPGSDHPVLVPGPIMPGTLELWLDAAQAYERESAMCADTGNYREIPGTRSRSRHKVRDFFFDT